MDAPTVLYTNPMSRGRIARWMLEETGIPYEVRMVAYGPEMKGAAYRAINPMGKVPALVRGPIVVTETAAICAWLADVHPEAGLAPAPADPARADYLRWLFFAAGPVEAAVTNTALKLVPEGDRARGMAGYGSLEAVVDTLEDWLDGRAFVAGERFSAADVYLGAQIAWGMEFGTIPRRPALEAYATPLTGRPACRRAKAADDAAMADHPMHGG